MVPNRSTPEANPCLATALSACGGAMSLTSDGGGILTNSPASTQPGDGDVVSIERLSFWPQERVEASGVSWRGKDSGD